MLRLSIGRLKELHRKVPVEVDEAAFDTIVAVCQDVLDKYPQRIEEDTLILAKNEGEVTRALDAG